MEGLVQAVGMAVASFAVFGVVHVLVWQLPIRSRGVLLIAALAVVVFALATAAGWIRGLAPLAHVFVSGPVFLLLTVLYMHLYVGVDRSVSLRILGEVLQRPDATLSREALRRTYPPEEMFRHRVDLLVRKAWLREGPDGRLMCAPTGRRAARLTAWLHRLYGMPVSG
jgi:hypothetical protein